MKNKGNSLSTIFWVIAIVLILILVGMLYTQKIQNAKKVSELENKINEMQKDLENTSIDISKKIILDGRYGIPGTDSGWEFTSDGKTAVCGNMSITEGIYRTIGENLIIAHYTKDTEWDDNGNEIITDVDWYSYIYIDENNDIYWLNSNKMLVELERFGDVVNIEQN